MKVHYVVPQFTLYSRYSEITAIRMRTQVTLTFALCITQPAVTRSKSASLSDGCLCNTAGLKESNSL